MHQFRSSRRLLALLTAALVAVVVAVVPATASEPETSEVTAAEGQTVSSAWTGTIPPGAGAGISCSAVPTADQHEVTITVPDGVTASATFVLGYTGATDQRISVVTPDGTTLNADENGNDSGESVSVEEAVTGVYTFYACPFAADAEQAYDGRVDVAAETPGGGEEAAPGPVCPAPEAPTFEQAYIDETRAGGEPIITTHPDGTLLWGSHAGTTHIFGPAAPSPTSQAFAMNYEGQTYQYFSADGGETWEFTPRTPINADPASGAPNSGFSDPEFAIDSAGNVFISEINLANIAFSKSSDAGRSYTLQSLAEITFSDRQWMDADTEDMLWFVANTFGGGSTSAGEPITGSLDNRLYKSVDGGQTFSEGQVLAPGQRSSDIHVDKSDGALYQLNYQGGEGVLEMFVMADAREQTPPDVTFERFTIAEGVDRGSTIGPTFDLDADGNLYVVWDDLGGGDFERGIYTSYSTDRGRTWADPTRVDDGTGLPIWPWLAVGDEGNVAVTWLQTDDPGEADDVDDENPNKSHPSEFVEGPWTVEVAVTQTGTGCSSSDTPGFTTTTASTEPVHEGTICNGGTLCQAGAVDRRLGDYFANTVARDGSIVIAVSDTRSGGLTSLPLVIRQTGGPSLVGAPMAGGPTTGGGDGAPDAGGGADGAPTTPTASPAPTSGTAAPAPTSSGGGRLPATGGGAILLAGLALTTAALTRRRG